MEPRDVKEKNISLLEKKEHKKRSKTPIISSKYIYITFRVTAQPTFKNSINKFFGDIQDSQR